jgi:hypothetical protein
MKLIKLFTCLLIFSSLAACGAGGGNAGAIPNSGTTTTNTSTTSSTSTSTVITPTGIVTVDDYIFELDKFAVKNTGTDDVLLSVTTLDKSRNIVPGVAVSVSVDAGGVFTPVAGLNTDATGKFTGKIGIGGNKTDRTINATISVNGKIKVVAFAVSGTKISVTPVPAVPIPGQTVTLNIKVTDSGDVGIANTPVQLSGTVGFSGVANTDFTGNLQVNTIAPASGNYLAIVSASGVTVAKPLTIVSLGGVNTIPNATPTFSGASLLANPASIPPNILDGVTNKIGTTNRSVLTAKFLRADNSTVANMRVRFEIVAPALGAGEFISTGDAIAYSDSSGVATADYVAGLRSSPTNGIKVRACFDYVDFPAAGIAYIPGSLAGTPSCPNEVLGALTVNSQPLDISIGNFNKLETGLGGIAYVQKFLIQVADSSGNAVKDAVVSTSVDITHFGKGFFFNSIGQTGTYYITGGVPPTASNLNYPTALYPSVVAVPPSYNSTTDPSTNGGRVWCVNEDRNRNGTKDAGEDINNNNFLEPGKSEVVLSYVSGNKTDQNGQLLIQVAYPQNMGTWLAYTIKATTSVVGSEGTKERAFLTDVLIADIPNGSFRTPPFGFGSCSNPN